jgi:hypothetical protein
MPSELMEFLFFSFFMVLLVWAMGSITWVVSRSKKGKFPNLVQKNKPLRSKKISGAHYNEP